MLPILLILLLGAIDLGRAFFGWVNLHQAARIGANFAAMNPELSGQTGLDSGLVDVIRRDIVGANCASAGTGTFLSHYDSSPASYLVLTYTEPDGTNTDDAQLGDYARLRMACPFDLLTPLASALFGDITLGATAVFPVRDACIGCEGNSPGATPPPTPVQCFEVPNMVGMSLEGARLAWVAHGFSSSNWNPPPSAPDTATVERYEVDEHDPLSTCVAPDALFTSTVEVFVLTAAPENPPDCITVPNLIGLPVSNARLTWAAAGFTGTFDPADQDALRVTGQETTPPSSAGVSCLAPAATVTVDTGSAWPPAPPTPCEVPNLIGRTRAEGLADWRAALFTGSYSPANGGWSIKSQSLVELTYLTCSASITVAPNANAFD